MKPDTIVALASGAGRAGVAVIRLSGPAAGATLGALTARDLPKPRAATREAFCDPRTGRSLDDGLALWFPGPHSFTGEDVAELQIHGGPAVIAAIIDACLSQPGVRIAEPGEYTRRAFENGKLDLAEAEGLADLVDAETEGQRRQALRQRRGALSAVYEGWRGRLIEAAALIEAEIDFPDEDLPGELSRRAGPLLQALADDMARHLDDAHRGERIRDGYRIAIIGPPNAGKSSLLNALAQREAAIVSDIPGTTRDVVEVRLVLAGYPVWIADTAGLREAADAIEAEGVRRALARAEEADLRIALVEVGHEVPPELAAAVRHGDLLVRSKADRLEAHKSGDMLEVSALTGIGLAQLHAQLVERVAEALGREEAPVLTRARHRRLVEAARGALLRAFPALDHGAELAAEDVRVAADQIGRLTGRIDVEDLLGEIFSSFCIGK
ncbi:MAG TPA: tRNA uridine-5-carboxymethylaminomethyl(34) synthesis GTPase MnmE [Vitreimonas sp.]|uniref:tRNA uridine-5-carboxymethylaminomethyl(34) synthesis GTPase MnmE n=1 Tax=Vitreimonas sp. TaxID=3069702 RepID=UPI002D43258A|nr:tRNA uridine-5-carboxymethylaminomethyl(34) synthesis GTPase MnmE [Vitreimonas sp.]HYD89568.1 tRNA uridine-5-carboxymethylaminomethyl(34) synthesis GTPase MnmE [Vitreimonas sp.]